MNTCKKCNKKFKPQKGLKQFCSLACRNSRVWTKEDKLKKSTSAKNSEKVLVANRLTERKRFRLGKTESLCLGCNTPIIHNVGTVRKYHTECWLKNSGGLREGSTKKHRCEYKGYIMDSGAEKAFAIKCDQLEIKWTKNKTVYFEYVDIEGKVRKYYPDFYLEQSNRWVEVKGKFYEKKDPFFNLKLKAVPNLILIYSTDIKNFEGVV